MVNNRCNVSSWGILQIKLIRRRCALTVVSTDIAFMTVYAHVSGFFGCNLVVCRPRGEITYFFALCLHVVGIGLRLYLWHLIAEHRPIHIGHVDELHINR